MIFNPVIPIAKKIETIQARDITVGSSVYLNEGGNYVEYLVVNQGIPSNSSLYDSSCNGTWLLRKDIHSDMTWLQTGGIIYSGSDINTWLNGKFFYTLGSVERSVIKRFKIPYVKNYSSGAVASGANGLSTKSFVLSLTETGFPVDATDHIPEDGEKLSYFESGDGDSARNKRIANLNGTPHDYWTRSTAYGYTSVWRVSEYGSRTSGGSNYNYGVRPALILPFNAEFDKTNMRLFGATTDPSNFANATWAQIIDACQKNAVPDTWDIGDQKNMTIGGTDYAIDIIGKNHDTYSDGSGTAPLTFQLHDLYKEGASRHYSTGTNVEGWTNSDIRQITLPRILSLMPTEVKNGIKEVNKLTSAGNQSSTINTTEDKLFLLSAVEIMENAYGSYVGEGAKYDYYSLGGTKVKEGDGVAEMWWTRSPYQNTTSFVMISKSGAANGADANSMLGVSFAFCF